MLPLELHTRLCANEELKWVVAHSPCSVLLAPLTEKAMPAASPVSITQWLETQTALADKSEDFGTQRHVFWLRSWRPHVLPSLGLKVDPRPPWAEAVLASLIASVGRSSDKDNPCFLFVPGFLHSLTHTFVSRFGTLHLPRMHLAGVPVHERGLTAVTGSLTLKLYAVFSSGTGIPFATSGLCR